MIRFFIFCIVLLALYLGFTAITQYDIKTLIILGDYSIETTLFTIITIFIFTVIISLMLLKIVFTIFELPFLIRNKLYSKKIQQTIDSVLFAATQVIVRNNHKARKILNKIKAEIKPEYQDQYYLVLATAEKEFEKKIEYFGQLIESKDYSYYGLKALAKILFEKQLYEESESYANKAFNIEEFDIEVLQILLRCYAKLQLWTKFDFIILKIKKTDESFLSKIYRELSQYYFIAAKELLEKGNDMEALKYLGLALEYNPSYIDALDLYVILSNNLASNNILEVLKTAFIINPLFEIAEMYIKASKLTNIRAYEELSSLVDSKNYTSLFLSIAAFLDLPEKITLLKEQKLITAV